MAAEDLHAHSADAGVPEDDLFDFDELIQNAEQTADELTAELDQALAEAQPELVAAPAPAPAARATAHQAPTFAQVPAPGISPLGFRDRYEPDPESEALAAPDDGRALGRARLPSTAVLIALAVLGLANLSLVGLTWKSMDTTRELVASAGHQPAGVPGSLTSGVTTPRVSIDFPSSTLGGPDPEGRAALEAAERSLAAGDVVAARRAVYALLAVIDRIPQAEREDVEARATFLVAETYRLQARRAGQEVSR